MTARKFPFILLAAGLVALGMASNAQATLTLIIDSSATPVGSQVNHIVVVDQGAGDNASGVGDISFTTNNLAGFTHLIASIATSNAAFPDTQAVLTQSTQATRDTSPSGNVTLTITAVEDNFTFPASPATLAHAQGEATKAGQLYPFTFESDLISGGGGGKLVTSTGGATASTGVTFSTPYTLQNITTANFAAATSSAGYTVSTLGGSTTVTAVPAPGALVLALCGLPFGGAFWLRRRKARAAQA